MKRFCSKCGAQMKVERLPASRYSYKQFMVWDSITIYPYSDFDSKTGQAQFVNKFSCPNQKWYSIHDEFIDSKLINKSIK